MPSQVVHLELTTPYLKKAKDFYGQLCGWTFDDAPMPPPVNTYALFNPGTGPGGGSEVLRFDSGSRAPIADALFAYPGFAGGISIGAI